MGRDDDSRNRRAVDALKAWISPALFALCAYFLQGIHSNVQETQTAVADIRQDMAGIIANANATERQVDRHEKTFDRFDDRLRSLERQIKAWLP